MAAPFTLRTATPSEKKMVGGFVYHPLTQIKIMKQRPLRQKKNDWVLIAFILERNGEISLAHLSQILGSWKRRDNSNRRLANIMKMHRKKGFERTQVIYSGNSRASMYIFNGELPKIDPVTYSNWEQRLSLRDNTP